jgi:cytochrome c oxidase subunit IV
MRWTALIIVLLLAAPLSVTANVHENHQHCTTLYTLTFPPQKKCMILTHPNAQEEQRINAENIQYNAGVQAGHASEYD